MPVKQTVIVNVTRGDIRGGCQSNAKNCPIARALERRGFRDPCVGPEDAVCSISETKCRVVRLPAKAKAFITHFDKKGRRGLKPFRFKVTVPANLLRA